MSLELTPEQLEINRWIERLDEVAKSFESIWGIDRLPRLVQPDLAAKWDRQINKLNEAIINGDLRSMHELGQGTIRAWTILDAAARQAGHLPNVVDVWDFQHPMSGRRYRICKNLTDARAAAEEDTVVYTLEEIANLLEANQMVNVVKENFPGAIVDKAFKNWATGDEIPF